MLPRAPGIYQITCSPTGKFYIGSTTNIYTRWHSGHRSLLRRGVHYNPYLQNAWNKYGEQAFSTTVLDSCDSTDLIAREQFWLDTLQPFGDRGFNIAIDTENSHRGRKHSLSTIMRLCAIRRDRPQIRHRKRYRLVDPLGIEYEIVGLEEFCKLAGLSPSGMYTVASGKQHTHRGWKCQKIP